MADDEKKIDRDFGKVLATWAFPESSYTASSRSVVIGELVIFLGLLLFAIFTKNYIFLFLIILIGILIFIFRRDSGRRVQVQLTDIGVLIGSKFYYYHQISNFRIVYFPPDIKSLYFDFSNILITDQSVPLEDQNPVEIRKILLRFLQEDLSNEDQPFIDHLTRWLRL